MATATKNQQAKRNTETANESIEAAAERIRDLNERIFESSKKAGHVYVDLQEKTLNSIADYQQKVGTESELEWVSTIANAQADFTRQLSEAYTSSARSLLK